MDITTWHLFLLFPQWSIILPPWEVPHNAREDLNTLELILKKELGKLARLTLLLHSSYGIKHTVSAIHPIQLSSPQPLLSKLYFGSCRWIFMCSMPLPPFPQPLLKPSWPLKPFTWNLMVCLFLPWEILGLIKKFRFLPTLFKLAFSCLPCFLASCLLMWFLSIYVIIFIQKQCWFHFRYHHHSYYILGELGFILD